VGDQRTLLAKSMIEQGIRTILANLGNEIKIHKLDEENIILEIDYEKYIKQILDLVSNQTK
jgi:hemerythrin